MGKLPCASVVKKLPTERPALILSGLLIEIAIPAGIQLSLIWIAWNSSPIELIGTMWDDFFLLFAVLFLGMPTDTRFFHEKQMKTVSNLTTDRLKGWLNDGKYKRVLNNGHAVSILNFMGLSEKVFTYNLSAISKTLSVFTLIPYLTIELAVLWEHKRLDELIGINRALILFSVAIIIIKVKSIQMQSFMGAR